MDGGRVPFAFSVFYPPLYKFKVKGDNKVYWFDMENKFIMVSGLIKDLSEMGDLIQKKQKELGI